MYYNDYQEPGTLFGLHPYELRPSSDMDGGDAVRRHGGLPRTRPVHTNAGGWRIETRAVALPPYNKNVRCDVLPAPTDHAQELRPVEPRQLDHNKKVRDLKL